MSSMEICSNDHPLYEPVTLLARHYHEATGVSIRVFNQQVDEIYRADRLIWGCDQCQMKVRMSAEGSSPAGCGAGHVLSVVRSKPMGSGYVYRCQSGFAFWSSSIIINGEVLANLVAASPIAIDIHHSQDNQEGFKVKFLNEGRVAALVEILALSCRAFSSNYSSTIPYYLENKKESFIALINKDASTLGSNYRKLLDLIQNKGNREEIKNFTKDILDECNGHFGADFSHLYGHLLTLAQSLSKEFLLNDISEDYFMSELYEHVEPIERINRLFDWFHSFIELLISIPKHIGELKYGHLLIQSMRYIHLNFAQNIALEDASRVAKLSPSYFSRLFKTEISISFSEYLNQVRINESKRKLELSDKSLAQIAVECGFSDQSYYTKIFKRTQGISPGRYRQQWRKMHNTALRFK